MESNENTNEKKAEETKAAAEEVATPGEATVENTEAAEPKKEEVDYKAKFFYLAAEMENYRKRMERERENLVKFGNERLLSDLIEVVDNYERTIDMLSGDQEEKVKNLVIGLEMIRKQFLDAMAKHGLTQVEALGKDFDPNFHEAITQEYVEGKKPHEVVKEYQKGYVLNGRLLRASKVVVASDKQ